MGTLFDGYSRDPLGPQAADAPRAPWDEMFPADATTVREPYRELYPALARMSQDELRGRTDALASSYLAQGVTFDFAGEERPFPLDAVPRVIAADDWAVVEAGVAQRVRALEAFLADVYGPQLAVRDGVIPASLISSSTHYHRQASGIENANGVRIHVAGIDVIRDERGDWRVLEDNVRVPSGVSYVDLEPPGHGADPARALHVHARAPRRRLPEPSCCRRCAPARPKASTTRPSSCCRPACSTRRTSSTPCSRD